jgi:hypothetical protein
LKKERADLMEKMQTLKKKIDSMEGSTSVPIITGPTQKEKELQD